MDIITAGIASLDWPIFTEIAKFLDFWTYIILAFVFAIMFFSKNEKIKTRAKVLFFSCIILFVTVLLLQFYFAIPRPCQTIPGKIDCPSWNSFPSGHMAAVSIFMIAALGTSFFYPLFVFALIVGFSRIYLGVHVLNDPIGGLVVAIIVYGIIEFIFKSIQKRRGEEKEYINLVGEAGERRGKITDSEVRRQSFHLILGIAVLVVFSVFYYTYPIEGINYAAALIAFFFVLGLIALDLKLKSRKVPIVDFLLKKLERPDAFPGHGSFWYILGLLLILSFLSSSRYIVASIIVLSFSDTVSTVIGKRGHRILPYNKNKTIEGSMAFFLVSMFSLFVIGPIALLFSFILALVESLPLPVDDNLSIPIACIIFFAFI